MHKAKRRKTSDDQQASSAGGDVDTSKPTAVFTPTGGRSHTLSVALPGSIIANAQSHEQKTYLAGAIARALAVFCVDEIVVFDDDGRTRRGGDDINDLSTEEYTAVSDPSHFLAHLLSYLETPQYLRKHLFPMHRNLRTAGTLPSLDMPHHLRYNEQCEYREGVTVGHSQEGSSGSNTKKKRTTPDDADATTVVETGLPQKVYLHGTSIPENMRVTVKFQSQDDPSTAEVVAPSAPREEAGYYWGYTVRRCSSLSGVFTECPFDGGYDVSFGTSERGSALSSVLAESPPPSTYQHLLIVFGGVAGLETAVKADPELKEKGVAPSEAERLFDYWVNVLPGQGSRTIRTEEAVWLGLMGLRGVVERTSGRT